MSDWVITWWDSINLREMVIPMCSVQNVLIIAQGMGVNLNNLIKIERMPIQ